MAKKIKIVDFELVNAGCSLYHSKKMLTSLKIKNENENTDLFFLNREWRKMKNISKYFFSLIIALNLGSINFPLFFDVASLKDCISQEGGLSFSN